MSIHGSGKGVCCSGFMLNSGSFGLVWFILILNISFHKVFMSVMEHITLQIIKLR